MHIEISETLTEKDSNDLFHWRERVFPIEGKGIEWRRLPRHIVCRDEKGKAIGHIGFGQFSLLSAGEEIPVVGVGGVAVRPEHQGKGIPARMFEVLHRGAAVEAACFTLFCPQRLESYYAKHGYEVYRGAVKVFQKKQPVVIDFSFMFRGNCRFDESITLTGEPW